MFYFECDYGNMDNGLQLVATSAEEFIRGTEELTGAAELYLFDNCTSVEEFDQAEERIKHLAHELMGIIPADFAAGLLDYRGNETPVIDRHTRMQLLSYGDEFEPYLEYITEEGVGFSREGTDYPILLQGKNDYDLASYTIEPINTERGREHLTLWKSSDSKMDEGVTILHGSHPVVQRAAEIVNETTLTDDVISQLLTPPETQPHHQ